MVPLRYGQIHQVIDQTGDLLLMFQGFLKTPGAKTTWWQVFQWYPARSGTPFIDKMIKLHGVQSFFLVLNVIQLAKRLD